MSRLNLKEKKTDKFFLKFCPLKINIPDRPTTQIGPTLVNLEAICSPDGPSHQDLCCRPLFAVLSVKVQDGSV